MKTQTNINLRKISNDVREEQPKINTCKRFTNSGSKCKNKIKEGESYCHLHQEARPYSKVQIEWLKGLEKELHIRIRHAKTAKSKSKNLLCRNCGHCNHCEGGEFYIHGVGKVDGYCKTNNTVYEMHGDFWHGNPKYYNSNNINFQTGITFGELYRKTLERDQKIRNLGYNLVTIWESDYYKSKGIQYDPKNFNTI